LVLRVYGMGRFLALVILRLSLKEGDPLRLGMEFDLDRDRDLERERELLE